MDQMGAWELNDEERAALLQLFDSEYYLAANPDVLSNGSDPLEHFLDFGWQERRNPSRLFDVQYYLDRYRDVAEAGVNPLIHFIRHGRTEGRQAHALSISDELRAALSRHFDAAYYLSNNADVQAAGIDPMVHFHLQGWREGRDPSPRFHVRSYLSDHPDVAADGIDPLLHYARWGEAEGRLIRSTSPLTDDVRAELSKHFDADYYLWMNPDIREAGVDPLSHFHVVGWIEGRNPNRNFDVKHYLRGNPDVAEAGINPLLHYSYSGRSEGRSARRPLDMARRQIETAIPAHQRAADWTAAIDGSIALLPGDLGDKLGAPATGVPLVLSISHDDYAMSVGGIQNLIGDELRAFRSAGWDYLHVSPAAPRLAISSAKDVSAFRISLRLNGEKVGAVEVATLAEWLQAARQGGRTIKAVVHHLMGHAPEAIGLLLQAAGARRPLVWLHDFFTVCPSYALMRNDATFCSGPPPESAACMVCCYGAERPDHLSRITTFFEAFDAIVVTPSTSTRDWWLATSSFRHARMIVAPLARLALADSELLSDPPDPQPPIRVAHLGGRAFHKGWSVFEEIAIRLSDDRRYAFYQLGHRDGPPMPSSIRHVPVAVTPESRDAMITMVAEMRIDVVVNWALWPETYSFTTYEALAGGAFVVARRDAGNVWPAVRANAPGQGCAVDDESELVRLFELGDIVRTIRAAHRRRGALILGSGSGGLLLDA